MTGRTGLILCAGALAAAAAGPAAGWTGAARVVERQQIVSPALGSGPAGAFVVWTATPPNAAGGPVTVSPVGAAPAPGTVISGSATAIAPMPVRVAGVPLVAWTEMPAGAATAAAARIGLNGLDGAPAQAVPGSDGLVLVGAAGGADGTLALVGRSLGSAASPARLSVLVRRPDGVWEPPYPVAAGTADPAVDVGGGGVVAVAAGRVTHVRTADGVWRPGPRIRPPRGITARDVAVGADGDVRAAWLVDRRQGMSTLWTGGRAPDGTVSAPRAIAGPVWNAALTAVGGGIGLVWGRPARDSAYAQSAPAGRWSAAEPVGAGAGGCAVAGPLSATGLGDGGALVMWRETGTVWTAHRTPDGRWDAAVPLNGAVRSATWLGLVADDGAGATVAWAHQGRTDAAGRFGEVLDAARTDAAGIAAVAPGVRAGAPPLGALTATPAPGGRVRVSLRFGTARSAAVVISAAPLPAAPAVPPRTLRGTGLRRTVLVAPTTLRGRSAWVSAQATGRVSCVRQVRVRVRR